MTRIAALDAFARRHPDLFDGEWHFGNESNDAASTERRSLIARFFRDHGDKNRMQLAA